MFCVPSLQTLAGKGDFPFLGLQSWEELGACWEGQDALLLLFCPFSGGTVDQSDGLYISWLVQAAMWKPQGSWWKQALCVCYHCLKLVLMCTKRKSPQSFAFLPSEWGSFVWRILQGIRKWKLLFLDLAVAAPLKNDTYSGVHPDTVLTAKQRSGRATKIKQMFSREIIYNWPVWWYLLTLSGLFNKTSSFHSNY